MAATMRESQLETHSFGREYQALGEVGQILCVVLAKTLDEA